MTDQTTEPSGATGDAGGASPSSADGRAYDFRLAWREHRPHVAFATALFVLGSIAGAALAVADVDLLAAMGLEDVEELFEGVEFTALGIFLNNTQAFLLMVAGAISLGLLTAIVLVFNGIFVGWLGTLVALEVGVGPILVLLLPHGVFELPALFVAGGIGFRLVHLAVDYLRGARDHYLSTPELTRTLLLLVVAWIVLAFAAVVEVHVTPEIADAIYGDFETPDSL